LRAVEHDRLGGPRYHPGCLVGVCQSGRCPESFERWLLHRVATVVVSVDATAQRYGSEQPALVTL
jgi:hypothetical protein